MKPSDFAAGLSWSLVLLTGGLAGGAPITESEAIGIAEWWYAAEVNAATTQLPAAEKQARVAAKNNHTVSYILGLDNWQPARKATDAVAAYVVAFQPSGFVVVSGEDALQPVLMFNAAGSFQWDGNPKTSYLSYYLGRCVVSAAEWARSSAAADVTHTNWTRFREWEKSGTSGPVAGSGSSRPGPVGPSPKGGTTPSGPTPKDGGIYVFLPTATWGQFSPYNYVCNVNNGNQPVYTGCVATAMAIQMRYFQWPPHGKGSVSYTDNTLGYYQSVDFDDQDFDWSNMPTNNITAINYAVANLMYDCGVAVDMDYGLISVGAGSSAWYSADTMNSTFCYFGTQTINSDKESDHTSAMSFCIQCGVPVVIGTAEHCLVVCGYRNTVAPYFYLNLGWGNFGKGDLNGWVDLDLIPEPIPSTNFMTIRQSFPYSTPDNYAYVSYGESSYQPTGSLEYPWTSIASGQKEVSSGGVLWLLSGQYPGSKGLTLNKPMTVKCCNGTAHITQ